MRVPREDSVLGAAWVQAEVVDRPTVSAQDAHLPGGLAQLGGRCGWELPYKARARTAGPRHCAYAPRGDAFAHGPGASGLPRSSPPALASGLLVG